jgi:hypothetical protein
LRSSSTLRLQSTLTDCAKSRYNFQDNDVARLARLMITENVKGQCQLLRWHSRQIGSTIVVKLYFDTESLAMFNGSFRHRCLRYKLQFREPLSLKD